MKLKVFESLSRRVRLYPITKPRLLSYVYSKWHDVFFFSYRPSVTGPTGTRSPSPPVRERSRQSRTGTFRNVRTQMTIRVLFCLLRETTVQRRRRVARVNDSVFRGHRSTRRPADRSIGWLRRWRVISVRVLRASTRYHVRYKVRRRTKRLGSRLELVTRRNTKPLPARIIPADANRAAHVRIQIVFRRTRADNVRSHVVRHGRDG